MVFFFTDKTVYECNFCRRTYKIMWRMEQHMKQEHPNEKVDGVPGILRGYSGLESQQLARNVSTQHGEFLGPNILCSWYLIFDFWLGPNKPPPGVETGIANAELSSEDNQIQVRFVFLK